MKEKLLERLPKKYHDRVAEFEQEDGLIDGCKYMLYFTKGCCWHDEEFTSLPCRSISEAIAFVKDTTIEDVEEYELENTVVM